MKKYLTLFIIGSALLSGCSNASDSTKKTEVKTETSAPKALAAEDQKIIDKHNEYVQKYSLEDSEVFQKRMREILPEVDKISDKRKRELLQMNIYMILNEYDKAYALNEKQLEDKPNDTARLTFKCQLLTLQKKETTLINKCFDTVAEALKVELDKPENKANPNYKQAEFSYLLAKYKGGHSEYKEKMHKFIEGTNDEALKASLRTIYDAEVGN